MARSRVRRMSRFQLCSLNERGNVACGGGCVANFQRSIEKTITLKNE